MPGYLVKVIRPDGSTLSPAGVTADDIETAKARVKEHPSVAPAYEVRAHEVGEQDLESMFGAHEEGAVVFALEWAWDGDNPRKQS